MAFAKDAGQSQGLDNLIAPYTQVPLGASQPCGGETSVKTSSDPISSSGQPRQRMPACLFKVESAIDALAKGRLTIVDTRAADLFGKYRIPGSLNIPLHTVKTKAFLKSQAFLLVNESHTSADLESICTDLKREGYNKVGVLQGGLFLWRARGGILEGDIVAARTLNIIHPSELTQELPLKDWLIIDVSNRKNPAIKKHFPAAISVPWTRDNKSNKALLAAMSSVGTRRILVIDETSDTYAGIEAHIGAQRNDALYLEGGLLGYLKYQREQIAMWKQRDEPAKRKGCSA